MNPICNMKDRVIIVFDCGATNIRAVAINQDGVILSSFSYPNQTTADPFFNGGKTWDAAGIWKKLCKACRQVIDGINNAEIVGVCTTTFGVDGAPFDREGNQLYPVISWSCSRTETIMEELHRVIDEDELHRITGVMEFPFNTVYKLFWLAKHQAELLKRMDLWLFLPSIINKYLCGALYTDASMAGTSMLCDLYTRKFSDRILSAIKLTSFNFPEMKEAGETLGRVTKDASRETGIPAGIPVFAAGHDTQFAVFGSGAGFNEAVLSSGTWEVLIVRTSEVSITPDTKQAGISTEFDAVPGLYNPGLQWIGSGILEWIREKYYHDISRLPHIYDLMIEEARNSSHKNIDLDSGVFDRQAIIRNLDPKLTRGEILKGTLVSLSRKLKHSLEILELNGGYKTTSLTVVGGGSRNSLWNELRSEAIGFPVKTISQTETTVLGAAMFAFAGAGYYASAEDARTAFLRTPK